METTKEIAFIVAKGRSGTTLLQMMLSNHKEIIAPIESPLILHLKSKYSKLSLWDKSTITEFIKDLYTDRRFKLFWNVSKSLLKEKLSTAQDLNFQNACNIMVLTTL